jgi:hypothetical protein
MNEALILSGAVSANTIMLRAIGSRRQPGKLKSSTCAAPGGNSQQVMLRASRK